MTIADTTTPTSDHGRRHAASIYQLIELRLQYMTATIAELIEELGEQPSRARTGYAELTARYEKISSEWLSRVYYRGRRRVSHCAGNDEIRGLRKRRQWTAQFTNR